MHLERLDARCGQGLSACVRTHRICELAILPRRKAAPTCGIFPRKHSFCRVRRQEIGSHAHSKTPCSFGPLQHPSSRLTAVSELPCPQPTLPSGSFHKKEPPSANARNGYINSESALMGGALSPARFVHARAFFSIDAFETPERVRPFLAAPMSPVGSTQCFLKKFSGQRNSGKC